MVISVPFQWHHRHLLTNDSASFDIRGVLTWASAGYTSEGAKDRNLGFFY